MGYTNYYRGAVATAEIAEDARKIIETAQADGIGIFGPLGTGEPIITATEIEFNGDASQDLDHETFGLYTEGHEMFGHPLAWFTKTARKPYDAAVVAVLISANLRSGQETTCDNARDADSEEIVNGINLFEKAVRPLTDAERKSIKEMYS